MRSLAKLLASISILIPLLNCGPADHADGSADDTVLGGELRATAIELRDGSAERSQAYEFLRQLTSEVGPRFAGSAGDRKSIAWATAKLQEMGFENVRAEPVTVPHWERGEALASVVSPTEEDLVVVALGGSVATPEGGLEAEVIEVPSLEFLRDELPAEQVAGKIVFINKRMERKRDGSDYGPTVQGRVNGASRAAEKGALAVVIRNVGTSTDRVANTGTMIYAEGVEQIPAAALSNPDADRLETLLAEGAVRLRLELTSRMLPDAESANVIGEIPGRERPEEIVLLACHLDSWDLGEGAIDDGLGCAIVAEAARLVGELPRHPRRTIRVFLAANEEFGLSGARAYAEAHAEEIDQHVVAMESDFGVGWVWTLRSRVDPADEPVVAEIAEILAPLDIAWDRERPAFGGADLSPLRPFGVPMFDLPGDSTHYFDYHHNANDVFSAVDKEGLDQAVAAWAAMAYILAEYEAGFGRVPPPDDSP